MEEDTEADLRNEISEVRQLLADVTELLTSAVQTLASNLTNEVGGECVGDVVRLSQQAYEQADYCP